MENYDPDVRVRAKNKGFTLDMSRPRTLQYDRFFVNGAPALCIYEVGRLFQSVQDAVTKLTSNAVLDVRFTCPLQVISPEVCFPKTSVKRWNRTEGVEVDMLDSIDRFRLAVADGSANYLPVIGGRIDLATSDSFSSLDYRLGTLKIEILPRSGHQIDDRASWFQQAARIMNVGANYFRVVSLR